MQTTTGDARRGAAQPGRWTRSTRQDRERCAGSPRRCGSNTLSFSTPVRSTLPARPARPRSTDGVDALVAVGGDGTVHVGLQAVAGTGVGFGVIPAGTGNDFAAELGLPDRPGGRGAGGFRVVDGWSYPRRRPRPHQRPGRLPALVLRRARGRLRRVGQRTRQRDALAEGPSPLRLRHLRRTGWPTPAPVSDHSGRRADGSGRSAGGGGEHARLRRRDEDVPRGRPDRWTAGCGRGRTDLPAHAAAPAAEGVPGHPCEPSAPWRATVPVPSASRPRASPPTRTANAPARCPSPSPPAPAPCACSGSKGSLAFAGRTPASLVL